MLEISEIEAGIRGLSKTDVELVQLVGEAIEFFQPIADENKIRLIFHAPDHLSVRGNVRGLQRIISY